MRKKQELDVAQVLLKCDPVCTMSINKLCQTIFKSHTRTSCRDKCKEALIQVTCLAYSTYT